MKKSLLILIVVLMAVKVNSQVWNGNTAINNAVCSFSNTSTKINQVSTSDGSGGMWIAWEDTRNTGTSGTDIYCQHISSDGTILLDAAGLLVTNATGNQTSISITDDGANGMIISWTDAQAGNNDIYTQRIKSDGSVAYATNGVAVSNTSFNELGSVVARLNATEYLVVWRDNRLGNTDIFVNKISIETGSKIFVNDSVIVNATSNQNNQQVIVDGNGGAYIIWEDPRVATSKAGIYAQHIDNSGVPLWIANGIAVCDPNGSGIANNRQYPKFVSDGASGFVATWADLRNGTTNNDIYAQRIASDGSALWTANGIAICNASGNQSLPQIASAGGMFFITWYDPRVSSTDQNIYAQAISADGTIQWDVNGYGICTVAGKQPSNSSPTATSRNLGILSDGIDGVIIIWDDARNSASTGTDIYAQRIKGDKTLYWAADGIVVSNATGDQVSFVSTTDGANGAIISWQDGRAAANTQIYASRLTATGLLPVSFLSISATPKSSVIAVEWVTSNEVNNSHFIVERSIDGTNFYTIATVTAKGSASAYTFNDASAVQGENYYRITSVDKDGTKQLSSIVKATLKVVNTASLQVYPNPTKAQVVIKLQGAASGKIQLKIVDAKGVLVNVINTTAIELAASKTINLQSLQNGVYAIQIVNAAGEILTSKIILKY